MRIPYLVSSNEDTLTTELKRKKKEEKEDIFVLQMYLKLPEISVRDV